MAPGFLSDRGLVEAIVASMGDPRAMRVWARVARRYAERYADRHAERYAGG